MPLIECIPNFSEGRQPDVIDAIVAAGSVVEGVKVLHVDPGYDANRTVVTLAGGPEEIKEAAFRMIAEAAQRIDLRTHTGAHARMGATDVCPLVPLEGISMEETAELARQLGERVGRELRIPVYLYEAAATQPHRRNLAAIRRGQFEGLPQKMQEADWQPDFGPHQPHPGAGATAIGARNFLVAFNMNLNTEDVAIAKRIAAELRESGRIIRLPDGSRKRQAGRCVGVKAIGWYMPSFGCAQVSTNMTDIETSPVHLAYESCRELAQAQGVDVMGAELIGMLPMRVLTQAGRYYRQKAGITPDATEEELIQAAVRGLGLDTLKPFVPEDRIIEYSLRKSVKKDPPTSAGA